MGFIPNPLHKTFFHARKSALTRKLRILPDPAALAPLSQAWERRIDLEVSSRLCASRQDRGAGGEGKIEGGLQTGFGITYRIANKKPAAAGEKKKGRFESID
jgi:hypothetical protein